jgi:hypothetical protein
MYRRVYFLSPNVGHAQSVVAELERADVERMQIHTIAREDVDISSLPPATKEQKGDKVWLVDRLFWAGDLFVFAMALLALIVTISWGTYLWAALAFGVMLTSFILGEIFATKVPHVHLSEVKGALARGEILLMVDIPKQRVHEINKMISQHHPEIDRGVVGWTIEALGT